MSDEYVPVTDRLRFTCAGLPAGTPMVDLLHAAADQIDLLERELGRMGIAREKLRQRKADRISYLEGQLQEALHPSERRVWVDGTEVDFLVIYREWQRYQRRAAEQAEEDR